MRKYEGYGERGITGIFMLQGDIRSVTFGTQV